MQISEKISKKVKEFEQDNSWECYQCGNKFERPKWNYKTKNESVKRWLVHYVCPDCFIKSELKDRPEFDLLVHLRDRHNQLERLRFDLQIMVHDSYDKTPERLANEIKFEGKMRAW